MGMPGRKYTAGSGYRYGFNGKEKASEITSDDYDYAARIYDGKLGRFLSVDPLQTKYSYITPYHFAGNNPTASIDSDGRDTIRFVSTVTIFSPITGPSGLKVGGASFASSEVTIQPAKGKDIFYIVNVTIIESANGSSYPSGKTTEFSPNANLKENGGLLTGTGITKSQSNIPFIDVNDPDAISLAKIAPEELISYLEKHNIKEYGGLRLEKAGQAVSAFASEFVGAVFLVVDGVSGLRGLLSNEGIIYERIDKTGNIVKPYVGQAKSDTRFFERQKEHARANPNSDFEYKIIDRGTPGKNLNSKEQKALDARGGPTNKSNPNGGTSNKKNVIKKTG